MGRKSTSSTAKRGKGKGHASDSSQFKGTTYMPPPSPKSVETHIEPQPTTTTSNNSSPSKTPVTTQKPPSKSPSPTNSPQPSPLKTLLNPEPSETDGSTHREPALSQGEIEKNLELEVEAQESSSEEEDVEVTGYKEGTPTTTVRSRVTRSSFKKVTKRVQEEQSIDSTPGTKRKRGTARTPRASKGMDVETLTYGSTDLSSRVVLPGCRTDEGYFDEVALSVVKELIEYQGWMSLFDVCDANTAGVRAFYVYLKQLPDMSLGSKVNDVDVNLSVASIASLLKVPRDGFDKYSGDGWPTLIGVTPDEIHDFIFGGKLSKKAGVFKTANLKEPVMVVLHSLCNKVIIHRAQGRGNVRTMEMVLIYLMMKKIKINLPSLMLNHMMNCHGSSHHSLPYGSFITKLLKENNVALSGSTIPVMVFTKAILKQKGLDISSGEVRFKVEEPAEVSKPSKKKKKVEEPAGQKVLLKRLESQEGMLSKLMSLVEGLSTSFNVRMSAVEKQLVGSNMGSVPVVSQPEGDQQADEEEEDEEDQNAADEEDKSEEEEEEEENDYED